MLVRGVTLGKGVPSDGDRRTNRWTRPPPTSLITATRIAVPCYLSSLVGW